MEAFEWQLTEKEQWNVRYMNMVDTNIYLICKTNK